MPDFLQAVLNTPSVSLLRRIHGLEHATINVLSQHYPGRSLAGHSDPQGFWLIGDVPTEAVQEAIGEALHRMRSGEGRLAIAPYCGTNLATMGSLAGAAGALAMWNVGKSWRDRLDRLALAATLGTLAVILAMPLGFLLQERVTTCGVPGELHIESITRTQQGNLPAHRVLIRGEGG